MANQPPPDDRCETQNAWGYIDLTGKVIIPTTYKRTLPFAEHVAAVQTKGGLWGYVDRDGKMVIAAKYSQAGSFANGRACVQTKGDTTSSYIDRSGAVVIDQVTDCHDFSNGFALFKLRNKYGYYDPSGTLIYAVPDAGSYEDMREGLAPFFVKGGKKTEAGFVTSKGRRMIIPRAVSAFNVGDGMAAFAVQKSPVIYLFPVGYVNDAGTIVIKPKYDLGSRFSEGLASVVQKGKLGFIDKKGRMMIKPIYEEDSLVVASPYQLMTRAEFREGRALVFQRPYGKKSAVLYIDKTGAVAIDLTAGTEAVQSASHFSEGRALISWEKHAAYIDTSGKEILKIPADISRAEVFTDGRAAVCRLN